MFLIFQNFQDEQFDYEADDDVIVVNDSDSDEEEHLDKDEDDNDGDNSYEKDDSNEDEDDNDSDGSLSPRNYILSNGPEFLRIHFGADVAANLENISEQDFYNSFNILIEKDDVANRRNRENVSEELRENASGDNEMEESLSSSASCSYQEE